ncbi:hypothetical protein PIB30_035349 [Stylosanthes scabra]|uniref:Putative plant transposon protein domain-containing protein n=1 Tax=Stylosanthes scabra TaxID=79078 RepID=A0ABU6VBD2_9FABA|nr:hypothetical protein [Stylosanthes scabra]
MKQGIKQSNCIALGKSPTYNVPQSRITWAHCLTIIKQGKSPTGTSNVGLHASKPQFDRGCTLYLPASRQAWAILATTQRHHVICDALTFEGARFKTPYHEAHFNSKLSARKILLELKIQVDESILDPCAFQIEKRKWERFTDPIQAVGQNMVREFYANAWEPEKEKRKPYTYTTMVRGKEISFAPNNIKRVLKLRKDPLPDAASYEERVANKDYRLDHVQEDLCIEGGEWVRHKDGRPHYLRRADLEPMTKGWYDFVCRSIMPTTNRSELTIYRRLDQQQEESRRSFEAINTRMDRMDDQLSFLCYSNQMVNKTMYYPYQNTTRQFREMEAQGVPVTIANLAIYRHREEEMNQERMRHNQTVQEAAAERAREENKGKAKEVVPDSEEEGSEELHSSASEEW